MQMDKRDWSGNRTTAHAILGTRNIATHERAEHDYYATEPKATRLLLEVEQFAPTIWECACGEGHMAKVLESCGYEVISTDLVDYGWGGVQDFLSFKEQLPPRLDIITNPPYALAQQFVEHSLDLLADWQKAAFFLKIQFLEGKSRRKMFERLPPKTIYVSTGRLHCARNGNFESAMKNNAICYAWFVWQKGYKGDPVIKWIN